MHEMKQLIFVTYDKSKRLTKQITCFCEHLYPTILVTVFASKPDVKISSFFFPLSDYYMMMSACSYSWCVVSVFGISLRCLCLSFNAGFPTWGTFRLAIEGKSVFIY